MDNIKYFWTMKKGHIFLFLIAFFSCKSQDREKSVFMQRFDSRKELLANGYNYVEHPTTLKGERVPDMDWLQKIDHDTTISYRFEGNSLLQKEIIVDKHVIDSTKLFVFLEQLGFMHDGTNVNSGSIRYSLENHRNWLWFIETFKAIEYKGIKSVDTTSIK